MTQSKCTRLGCGHLFKGKPKPHCRGYGLSSTNILCGLGLAEDESRNSIPPVFINPTVEEANVDGGIWPTRFRMNMSDLTPRMEEYTSFDCCFLTDIGGIGVEWLWLICLQIHPGEKEGQLTARIEMDEKTRIEFDSGRSVWDQLSVDEFGLALSIVDIYQQRTLRLGLSAVVYQRVCKLHNILSGFLEDICISEAEKGTVFGESKMRLLMPYVGGLTHLEPHVRTILQNWIGADAPRDGTNLGIRTAKHAVVADHRLVHRAACGCIFPGHVNLDTVSIPVERKVPIRFYDALAGTTVLSVSRDRSDDKYCCLSYPWASYDDQQLKDICRVHSTATGLRYYWVDRWCIDQKSNEEKAREIPNMLDYYSAADTVLILSGVDLHQLQGLNIPPGSLVTMTDDLREAAREWKATPWLQRCWTFQEAGAGQNCQVWTGGDEAHVIELKTMISIARAEELDLPAVANAAVGTACSETDPSQLLFGVCDAGGVDSQKIYSLSSVRCASHGKATYTQAYQKPLRQLLDMLAGRTATVEHDEYYSVFSIATEDNLPPVSYTQSVQDLVGTLIQTGILSTNILLTSTGSPSWLPKPCSQRQSSHFARGLNSAQPTLHDGHFVLSVAPFWTKDTDKTYLDPEPGQELPCVFGTDDTSKFGIVTAEVTLNGKLPSEGNLFAVKPAQGRSAVADDVVVFRASDEDGRLRMLGATTASFSKMSWNFKDPAIVQPLATGKWVDRELC